MTYKSMKHNHTGIKVHTITPKLQGSGVYEFAVELLPNGVASFEGVLESEVDVEVG